MNFKILRTKDLINLNEFTKIVDLFQSTFKIIKPLKDKRLIDKVEYQAVHTVQSWEQGRLDKIANKYYNEVNYLDGLMKYNGISNPFSVEEGRELLIPTKETLDASYRVLRLKRPAISGKLEKMAKLADVEKKSKIDTAKKGFNSSKKRNISPNIVTNGNVGIQRDSSKNKIILGANLNNRSRS
jgi:hypothetical protein